MKRLFIPVLLAAAPVLAAPHFQAEPSRVVLGRDHVVRLTLESPATLAWAVSEGDLQQVDPTHLVWNAPDSGTPRTAILLLWDSSEQRPDPVTLRIPLIGRTDLDIDTERRATVTVEIAGQSFGPRTADASGKVRVPVQVPPGAREALVHAQANGRRTERTVPLLLPPDRRVVAALSPHPITVQDGGFLLITGTRPLTRADVSVSVQHARATLVEATDPLVFSVKPEPKASEVTASAALENVPESRTMTAAAVSQQAPVKVGPSVPVTWSVGAQLGGFLGSGAATGLSAALMAGVTPGWFSRRLQLELQVGWEHTGLTVPVETLGEQRSIIDVLPITAAARFAAFARGPWQVGLRAGVGVAPWDHRLSSDFDASFREGGVTWTAQASADAAYSFGRWSPFVSAGYTFLPRLQTPHLSARLGGPRAELGVRVSL